MTTDAKREHARRTGRAGVVFASALVMSLGTLFISGCDQQSSPGDAAPSGGTDAPTQTTTTAAPADSEFDAEVQLAAARKRGDVLATDDDGNVVASIAVPDRPGIRAITEPPTAPLDHLPSQRVEATPATPPPSLIRPTVENPDAGEPAARLTVAESEWDFGVVYDMSELTHVFRFRNTGDGPLRIGNIRTSCGCTTAGLDKKVYAPGEEGELEVVYAPRGPGRATKFVTITSNDPSQPNVRLAVTAEMVPASKLEPNRLMFGAVQADQDHSVSMQVLSRDPEVEVVRVVAPRAQEVNFEVIAPATGEIDASDPFKGRRTIVATLPKGVATGNLSSNVEVVVLASPEPGAEKTEQILDGFISATVMGDLIATPRFIRVSRTSPGDPFEARTLVTTRSGKPFEITKVEVSENSLRGGVETSFEPTEDGNGYYVIVTGIAGDETGAFRGKLLIHHSLENEGPKPVVFNGITRAPGPAQLPRRISRDDLIRPGGDDD